MRIIIKHIPIEAHDSIKLVEYYHSPLHKINTIITIKLPRIKPKLEL